MTDETEETETKKLTAKGCSKLSMIFGTAWIAVLSVLKGLGFITNLDENEIIYSGVAMVALWSPTYLSIWLDKIREIKFGVKE